MGIAVKADSEEEIDDSHITVLTNKNFDKILKPAKHALIEFYAPWCGHCKAFRAGFAEAATILKSVYPSLLIAKIDADTEKDIGERFGIEGFPTFKFVENGEAISEFNDELTTEHVVEWAKKAVEGGSIEVTSIKQAESILAENAGGGGSDTDASESEHSTAPVVVVGYFKNGFKGSKQKEYNAFKKLAMRELNGNDVSFYRTSNPEVAAKLGVVLPTSSGTTSSGTTFGLAIRRKYPGHPETVIQYAGHKAEQLPASQEGDDATAADSEEAQILRKFKSFFYAEKLPDFVYYKDALLDGGNLVMSVPTEYHMYVVAPPAKLDSEATLTTIRDVASQLRGQIIILAADPAAEQPGVTPTMYPIASTFLISHKSTDFFVGVTTATNGTRFTCNIPPEAEELDSSLLVKCAEDILSGRGSRIFSSQPAPENPKQGNFTILVGTTMEAVINDPTKDVLLEVYAPWCGACRSFAPDYTKLAAAMADIPSVVVAKMDGSENDHREFEVQEFPTLLLYPAEKDAKAIRVNITDVKELAAFLHKNAKIPFDLPDLAPFKDMDVDLSEFADAHVEEEEEGEGEHDEHDGHDHGVEEKENVDEEEEDIYLDPDHDEL